jgi:hypothetical protein
LHYALTGVTYDIPRGHARWRGCIDVAPPSWLAAALAATLLVIAGYCATRLAAARWWRRSTDHGADVMHAVMGVAMAYMLVLTL